MLAAMKITLYISSGSPPHPASGVYSASANVDRVHTYFILVGACFYSASSSPSLSRASSGVLLYILSSPYLPPGPSFLSVELDASPNRLVLSVAHFPVGFCTRLHSFVRAQLQALGHRYDTLYVLHEFCRVAFVRTQSTRADTLDSIKQIILAVRLAPPISPLSKRSLPFSTATSISVPETLISLSVETKLGCGKPTKTTYVSQHPISSTRPTGIPDYLRAPVSSSNIFQCLYCLTVRVGREYWVLDGREGAL